MDCPGTGSHNNGNASTLRASTESTSSRLDLSHRRITDKYTTGHHPGSALAQRLVGSALPLIKCDGCPRQVLRCVSTTPQHPGWVFIKCKKRCDGCKFWFCEEEYIDRLIAQNLVDARALLARIEARDETRDDIRCEATSSSVESKKKEVCKLEKPQINNEDIEKILILLVGVVMEIGYLLKCLIVVLAFFGLALRAKNW
ncbi:hypothetical protein VPH35_051751 [Triticum aestivum]